MFKYNLEFKVLEAFLRKAITLRLREALLATCLGKILFQQHDLNDQSLGKASTRDSAFLLSQLGSSTWPGKLQ